jgi:hypothetical protein
MRPALFDGVANPTISQPTSKYYQTRDVTLQIGVNEQVTSLLLCSSRVVSSVPAMQRACQLLSFLLLMALSPAWGFRGSLARGGDRRRAMYSMSMEQGVTRQEALLKAGIMGTGKVCATVEY